MMMFVLMGHNDHDGSQTLGVFTSEEEADKYAKLYENNAIANQSWFDNCSVEGFEVIENPSETNKNSTIRQEEADLIRKIIKNNNRLPEDLYEDEQTDIFLTRWSDLNLWEYGVSMRTGWLYIH